MSESLVERAAAQLDRLAPRDGVVLLAVSGGPDSLAMLDLLVHGASRHRRRMAVGHVDHGIDPASVSVARQVASHASRFGLAYVERRLELPGATSETVARRARRLALREMAREVGGRAIVLAHHADDQAETVLLRVLAGSGPAGLAAMAPRRGPWLRPLLGMRREELRLHLESAGLSAWQDPANSDPRHLRSWLRITALPLLRDRFPGLIEALNGVAAQAAHDRAAWNQVPELLSGLDLQREGATISVAAPPLRGYRSEVQDAVFSALARQFGVPLGATRRDAMRQVLASGRSGAKVALSPALEAELTFDRLVLRRPAAVIPAVRLPEAGQLRAGAATFVVRPVVAGGKPAREGCRVELSPGEYWIRSWRPGDRIRPLGGAGSRTVAELFKESRVAAGARIGWPLLVAAEDDATIVWVPGICRSDARIPVTGKDALDVECDLA